jgi:pilus assembly protein Flp/PilA
MTLVLRQFLNSKAAATSIEYALIAAGISIAVAAVVNNVGTSLNNLFFGPVASALK